VDSCKYGNDPPGSMKESWEFVEYFVTVNFSRKTLLHGFILL